MRSRNAFTLMEMILVVVIIGLLAALVLPKVVGWGKKTRRTAALAQISAFKTALGSFERECGRFPTTTEGLRVLIERPDGLPEGTQWERFLDESVIPKDPWGRDYVLRIVDEARSRFHVVSAGPDGAFDTDDDISSGR